MNKRPSFSLKIIYLFNLRYVDVLKTRNNNGGVNLTSSFPDNIIFLSELVFFRCIPFLCPLSKEWFTLNENYAIQNNWISINIMGHPKETWLCSTCLELYLACSIIFKLAKACYWLFHFLKATKSQNVLTYKFTINQVLLLATYSFIQPFFFLLSGFSFTNIHESQDCSGRGRIFL